MCRTLQVVEELPNVVVGEAPRQPHVPWRNYKTFVLWVLGCHQPEAQEVIYHLLKGIARAPAFFFELIRDIIIQR